MNGLQFDSLFWIGVSPFECSRRSIVLANIAHEFGSQVGDRAKDATRNDVALDFGEPVFNLVQPGGISRRVVDSDIGVGFKEGIHQLRLMSREVVGNAVQVEEGSTIHDFILLFSVNPGFAGHVPQKLLRQVWRALRRWAWGPRDLGQESKRPWRTPQPPAYRRNPSSFSLSAM